MSKHDYEELVHLALDRLGEGEFTKARILGSVDLPLNQFTWRGMRTAFAKAGILCHYVSAGEWRLRWRKPGESAGAVEMWSRQVKEWCKNMREEFVGLIQATRDDAETYTARLINDGIDPTMIYVINEALDGALPPPVQAAMQNAYVALLPQMPRDMQDRIRARFARLQSVNAALLEPPHN